MNQTKLLLVVSLLTVVDPVTAQGGTEYPPNHGVTADAVDARLEVSSVVAYPNEKLTVTLTLDFKVTAQASATFLSGHYLTFHIGDKQLPSMTKALPNLLEYPAGTRLVRKIPIDLQKILPAGNEQDEVRRLTISCGVAGGEAVVRIVPDQRSLDVTKLDLERTKVRLVTSKGDMVIQFFPDSAPNHVEKFIELSRKAFYNGTRFHRIIRGQIVQGGCPNTKRGADARPGAGHPGYTLELEASSTRKHVRGILSMARGRDRDSAGSQFFLMHGDVPMLDGQYTIFGTVDSGLDVLDRIAGVRVKPNPYDAREASWPVDDVHLYAAVVIPVLK